MSGDTAASAATAPVQAQGQAQEQATHKKNKRLIVGIVIIGVIGILALVLHFTGIMKIVHTEKTPITNFQNSSDFATKEGRLMLILNNEILHKSDTISFWDKVKAVFIRYKWIIIGVVAVVLVFVWIFRTRKSRRGAAASTAAAEADAESDKSSGS